MKKDRKAEHIHGKPCLRMQRQLQELVEAYIDRAENLSCSQRGTMETLLSIFYPEELVEMGYGERVKAYLLENGAEVEWKAVSKGAGYETV